MQSLRCLSCTALLLAASLQAQGVNDVGLTIDNGAQTAFGQQCGPVICAPFTAGPLRRGERRALVHVSAPVTPYVLAIGVPGPCIAFTGIANVLQLGPPVTTLAVGVTSAPPFFPTPCQQGIAVNWLLVPPGAPSGLVVRFQSVGVSNSGALAFGPAIEATVQ